jgi:hypothetical protein
MRRRSSLALNYAGRRGEYQQADSRTHLNLFNDRGEQLAVGFVLLAIAGLVYAYTQF